MNPTLAKKILTLIGAIALVACGLWYNMRAKDQSASSAQTPSRTGCSDYAAVKGAIDTLSPAAIDTFSSEDVAKGQEASETLLRYSETSPACRSEIIALLIQAMDKPNLDFMSDKSTYFLWVYGSHVLGSLKAVEALDLLIDHLDENDGFFSASLSHEPAVLGVMKMGEVAVPKLDLVLRHDPNPERRLAAALCLSHIGGSQAIKSLEWAAANPKSDTCLRNFAKIAVKLSKLERESNNNEAESESEANTKLNLRRDSLLAYRCNKAL